MYAIRSYYGVEKRSGDATSLENVLQYGLNAAVLTRANAQLLLLNSDVTANALGAGGVYAYASRVQLENSVVRATGASAFALFASADGSVHAKESSLSTQGASSPALITSMNGQLLLEGGMAATGGENSPVMLVSGSVSATGATLRANNSEAIRITSYNVCYTK